MAFNEELLATAREIFKELRQEKREKFQRRVSLGDLLSDRWELAKEYGWGEGVSCYENVLVLGDVKVGARTWIGPNVILDGSGGGLTIGENCTICAGVQVYSHDSVKWALSGGQAAYEHAPTIIGNHCFVGPNAVIGKGVTLGNRVAVGACCFVRKDIADDGKFTG